MRAGGDDLPAVAVLLEPGSSEVFGLARSARDLCRLVFVADLSDPAMARERRALDRFGPVVDLHGRPGPDVVAELRSLDVRGLLSLTDAPLLYAAALAEHLQLPFHSRQVARLCTDKALQRARLAERGVPSAEFVVVPAGSPVPAGFPVPAVVKPRRGAGSRGVALATDAEAVQALVAAAREDVLVEELLPDLTPRAAQTNRADVLSVEVVVHDGKPEVLAVSQRWPLAEPWRETGSCYPAGLPADVEDGVVDVALAAVDALEVEHGFLHVEVKRTPTGPRIVEVNGRLGGMVATLHALAGGDDLVRAAYTLALGLSAADPVPLSRVGWLHWLHAPLGATRVVDVSGLDAVRALPGVTDVVLHVQPGSPIDPSIGNDARVVSVTGSAPDHATAFALRTAVLRAVQITTA